MAPMRTRLTVLLVISVTCFAAKAVVAHHAFASVFDSSRIVSQKGIVSALALLNPHSLLFVDSTGADGTVEHWAIELPTGLQLKRMNLDRDVFNPGETIEFCGYGTRDGVDPLKSYQRPEPISLSLKPIPRPIFTGMLISPAMVVLASGREIAWTKEDRCPSH